MSVTIDATVGGAASNSYVDLAAADAYCTSRLYSTNFTGKSADDRGRALIMARQRIDQENYEGYAVTHTQRLKWPRAWVQVPGELYGRYYEVTEIPQLVKDAQCEMALVIAGSDIFAPTGAENLSKLVVGPIELDFKTSISTGILPDTVVRLLRGLRVGGGMAAMSRA